MAIEFTVFGIAAPVLVLLIVQLIKKLFPSLEQDTDEAAKQKNLRIQVGLALGLGVLLASANKLIEVIPWFEQWYQVVVSGIIVGAISMGFYDSKKAI